MLIRIYDYAHDVLNIHFWDIPSIIVLVVIAVIAVLHTVRQKKRENDFEAEENRLRRNMQRKYAEEAV